VLENLGQLLRHDLSEAYGLLPNADGTFNNRHLDLFRTDAFAQALMSSSTPPMVRLAMSTNARFVSA